MYLKRIAVLCLALIILWGAFPSCKSKHAATKKEIVQKPEDMNDEITDNIRDVLQYALDNHGKINDSIRLALPVVVNHFYEKNDFHNFWSSEEHWLPVADSMFSFIAHAKYYGLYPEDYHYRVLSSIRERIHGDSTARKDAIMWTKADLLLSDAFMRTVKDLHQGRLVPDSNSIARRPRFIDSLFVPALLKLKTVDTLSGLLHTLEPDNVKYQALREVLPKFVDHMDTFHYQYINYPTTDSMTMIENLQRRLFQAGAVPDSVLQSPEGQMPDSPHLRKELIKYEGSHGLRKDGRLTDKLVDALNNTDNEKFKRIAITLDRYKLLPDPMPSRYVWVNLPGFYMELMVDDTVQIWSRVIVGKPTTPTPTLVSSISDMVTYPQWTIPASIIRKEILPALKKDPGYLAKKGYNIVDKKGDVVDPYTVDWNRYTHGIPWKIIQGSGDDNALGILKFNFNNPYSVYLHDTNQRYLFSNSVRALSHGCVRLQKWEKLAFFIADGDTLNLNREHKPAYNEDSLKTWLAKKDRKRIFVKNRLPLYFEYFTCVGSDHKLVIYNDIYNQDKAMAQKYFARK
ncbi:MAG: L,D-transpeptidase family protein [Bacteroidota bacterium]|nr:L,D-transpeptidase family protein [Bacteroidota bacterium]